MLINFRRLNKFSKASISFNTGDVYNKKYQYHFRSAYFAEPIEEPTPNNKSNDTLYNEKSYMNAIRRRFQPVLNLLCGRSQRFSSVLDSMILPTWIGLSLIYFPYHYSFKILTLIPSATLYTRIKLKQKDPELPETHLKEMIHSHERLGKLFKVDTTSCLNYEVDWDYSYPDIEKFPEYNNKLYKLFNTDGWFTKGTITYGDVDSGALATLNFKTMPIRKQNKFLVGEPYYFYDLRIELNHKGEFEEVVLADEKETLKKVRPMLIF